MTAPAPAGSPPTGRGSGPIDRGVLAIDRLTMAYLAATGLFAVIAGGTTGLAVAAVHAAVCFAIFMARAWTPERGLGAFLRVAYPVLMMPAMYSELATLNRFVTPRFFDEMVIGWEAVLFGGQPSMYLSEVLPWLPLSEAIHLGYMAYYLLMPAALIGAWFATGREGVHRTAFTLMATFYCCYAIFILFPVAGPRYEFERIGGAISDGTIYAVVHQILETGSSKGTAFPSSHVAASLAAVLAVAREDRRWLRVLLVPEVLLIVGTVYGRFHYAIDAVAGLVLGVAVWAAVPAVFGRLRGRQPARTPGYPTV